MALLRTLTVTSLAIAGLSACATTANPEKVCTAEWIGKRSDKAVSRIERKAKPALRKLSKAADSWARGDKPNGFQLMSLNSSVKSLTKELESGQAMKDLKTLSRTCNDPKIVTKAMTNLMRDNGLSEQMINFVENLPRYKDLIEKELTSSPVAQYEAPRTQMMHH